MNAAGSASANDGALLVAYVDESYTRDDFFLGALVVDGTSGSAIEAGLTDIVDEYAATFDLDAHAELHGYPLFHGEAEWSRVPTRVRINVYQRAMAVVGSSGAAVILRGMDVARQQERYVNPWPPHEVVLGHLLERVDAYAASRSARALVVADEVHSDDRHRTNFRSFRRDGTPGYRSSTLPHLLDTIHFGPSKHSRLLQAADLVTFMHRRRWTHVERDPRAREANKKIWLAMRGAIHHQDHWVP